MKNKLSFIIVILAAILLAGCSNKESSKPESLDKNEYRVYYLNSSKTALTSEVYTAASDIGNAKEIIDELVLAMTKPATTKSNVSAVTANVVILNKEVSENVLSVYFSKEYSQLAIADEVMFRAAFVKTVTQVPGIEYVSFYVNDQPFTDAMGCSVGMMSGSDFVENTGENINIMQWIDISLYYANAAGEKLATEGIKIGYGKNASVESAILEQLMKGPGDTAHMRTIPDTVGILEVSTEDGVCYVNFDSTFTYSVADARPEVIIYSIVNSLCELPTVNKVQLAVNGNSNVLFMNAVDLSRMFERNLSLLETTK